MQDTSLATVTATENGSRGVHGFTPVIQTPVSRWWRRIKLVKSRRLVCRTDPVTQFKALRRPLVLGVRGVCVGWGVGIDDKMHTTMVDEVL